MTSGSASWPACQRSRTSYIASFRTKSTAIEFHSALTRQAPLLRVSPARRWRTLVNCHPVLIIGNDRHFFLKNSQSNPTIINSYYFFKSSHHLHQKTRQNWASMTYIFQGCNHFCFSLGKKRVIFVIVGSFCIKIDCPLKDTPRYFYENIPSLIVTILSFDIE